MVRHRIGMFADMGTIIDAVQVEAAFRRWLVEMMPAGVYRAWVAETSVDNPTGDGSRGGIVSGGGTTILPWPPGPSWVGGRIAYVYNVYTEPAHRRRGLARLIMDAIHDWCREQGILVVGLNASPDGLPLYDKLGYKPTASPMMFVGLGRG
jgi:GNAT superfamily N-acetyltransferase